MRPAAIAVFILAATATWPSAAHEHATGVVKERMDAMTVMDKRVRAILNRLKSRRDLGAIKADAAAIAREAGQIARLFPSGSMQPPTRARPAIWQNQADFEAKAKALEQAARYLAAAPTDDVAALARAADAMNRACDACHNKYRMRGRRAH